MDVTVFDTTLRDGEQSPGASMNLDQKLQVAAALARLGVDVMEVGFPVASPGDFEAVRAISQKVEGPKLCALARCHKEDIDRTAEALKDASKKRIHVFLATSPLHRTYKLKMTTEQVLRRAVEGVAYAREHFDEVQFSAEDAGRTEPEFLAEVAERVLEAGATILNIPDTVGYALPSAFGDTFTYLKKHVRGIERATLSAHCHDDLGLAVANTLSALVAGARQVECTINGIGERAGNCALEEVVMALRVRQDALGLRTKIRTEQLYPVSRLVENMTGIAVQRNKAIVGQNAFAHEAGIHQHGVLAHPGTYEIMRPQDVGFAQSTLVFGKHSGRHLLLQRVKELGFQLEEAALDKAFELLKKLADEKKEITDADIESVVSGKVPTDRPAIYNLNALLVTSGMGTIATATVIIRHQDGQTSKDAAAGDGPVDAAFKAIERVTGVSPVLRNYQVSSVSVGKDGQGEVSVELEHEGNRYRARSMDKDIVLASARAFLEAINRIAGDQAEGTGPRQARASGEAS